MFAYIPLKEVKKLFYLLIQLTNYCLEGSTQFLSEASLGNPPPHAYLATS